MLSETITPPPCINMGDRKALIELITSIVMVGVSDVTGYYGAIIYGSIANGNSHEAENGRGRSDVDLKHVVDTGELDVYKYSRFLNEISVFFGTFGVEVESQQNTLDLADLKTERGEITFFQHCNFYLNKLSVVIMSDPMRASQVEKYGGFRWNQPIYHRKDH